MNNEQIAFDREGFLVNLRDWNQTVAQQIATEHMIELTDDHWLVIEALRNFYHDTDVAPAMRPFVKLVRTEVKESLGNSIELMALFGDSPAKMAARIAGLPRPTNCL